MSVNSYTIDNSTICWFVRDILFGKKQGCAELEHLGPRSLYRHEHAINRYQNTLTADLIQLPVVFFLCYNYENDASYVQMINQTTVGSKCIW